MKKIRAIYIGDVKYDNCPIFELNNETKEFEMLENKSFKYDSNIIEDDDYWLFFEVDIEEKDAKLINRFNALKMLNKIER